MAGSKAVRRGVGMLVAVLVAVAGGLPATAAEPPEGVRARADLVELFPGDSLALGQALAGVEPVGGGATASITVQWTSSTPSDVRSAVDRAATIWEGIIESDVPITVEATWEPLGSGALASAGSTYVWRDIDGLPRAGTWYPDALLDSLVGSQFSPSDSEITMNVNSSAPWFTGLSGGAGFGEYDLVTVALHELGHGLGISTSFRASGGIGTWGLSGYPLVNDWGVERGNGTPLLSLPSGSSTLGSVLTSGDVVFDQPAAVAGNGGVRPPLYAPSSFAPGSSLSHLDEDTFPEGDPDSLMTPFLADAETIHEPGPIARGILADIGWSITPLVTVPGAPVITASSGGDRAASVSWSAPASDGGAPISSYVVSASPSGRSVTVVGTRRSATLTGLTNGSPEQITVTARNSAGDGPPSAAVGVTPQSAGPPTGDPGYHPLVPARVLDTRTGVGGAATPFGANQTRTLDVTDTVGSGVPATGVRAVVLNVTATGATGDSDIRLWPTGAAQPNASNLNIRPGATIPNLVTVGVGPSGTVQVRNQSGSVHLIADVVGWFDDGTTLGVPFTSLSPTRILDTRKGIGGPTAKVGPRATRTLDVTDTLGSGVPASGVSAVLLNVTATGASADTFITAHPSGSERPQASNLNVTPARTIANLVAVPVGAGGTVALYNSAGSVDLIADVVGWYGAAGESVFTPVTPQRRFDTRNGSLPGGPFASKETRTVDVVGVSGVPAGATAVVINVTATNVGNDTFVTVWPSGVPRPQASNINVSTGWTLAGLVVAKVGADGKLALFDNTGPTDLLGDVVGWYGPPA